MNAVRVIGLATGVILVGAVVLGSATASAAPLPGPAPAGFRVTRVDVSHYPQVGMVLTRPTSIGPRPFSSNSITVHVGSGSVTPHVAALSPGDLRVAVALDPHLEAGQRQLEQAAVTGLLFGLPAGAKTAVVSTTGTAGNGPRFSADPTAGAAAVAALPHIDPQPEPGRLLDALALFPGGDRVRRTVVLVATADIPEDNAVVDYLRLRLLASGTQLYVFDLASRPSTVLDGLATASGGFAIRGGLATPGAALSAVAKDLASQYYLRFEDPEPLPGVANVTGPDGSRTLVTLPAANPVAPPPLFGPPAAVSQPLWDRGLTAAAALLVILSLCYGAGMLTASRREPRRRAVPSPSRAATAESLFFVFLLPCLNEGSVLRASLERLLAVPGDNFVILVVDDGSDDDTADVVMAMANDQVLLLRRIAPHARQGKGEALNAATRHLLDNGLVARHHPDNVIIVVVDADGRLDPHALREVTPYFRDPTVGAVQIGVRINNRFGSRLARMQDMEFVFYTEVFQRGRRHLGSVGLGGNGQFMRLSALVTLGRAAWSRSLTEDLDLGIRLLTMGWRNEYCHTAAVHQQGVVDLRRLVRQRSRWFQGHLQSWRLVPVVLRGAPRRARADLVYHLTCPGLLLIASLLTASFGLAVLASLVGLIAGHNPVSWWLLTAYLLSFGPALAYTRVYWRVERPSGLSRARALGLAHLYVAYGLMWYAAGWWAMTRVLRRQTGWVKTERTADAVTAAASTPQAHTTVGISA